MTSPEKLAKYLAYYKDQYQNSEKNWAQYDYEYTLLASAIETSNPIPLDVNAPCNCDIAYISADDTFQAMADAGYDMNVYFKNDADFDGSNFLKYLARNTNGGELDTDFGEIKAKLIDKISVGSTVKDLIGADFDFVNDPEKISLTVNGEKLVPEKIDDQGGTTYGFGKLQDGSYRYTLRHADGDQEALELTLNEAAVPSKPVVLEYSERLVNVPTEPGTHTLKVNESATLYPVDGNGASGDAYEFPVPEVTYTVAEPDTPAKPDSPTAPATQVKPATTAPSAKGDATPKTGDQTSPMAAAALLAAGAGACTLAMTLRRRSC